MTKATDEFKILTLKYKIPYTARKHTYSFSPRPFVDLFPPDDRQSPLLPPLCPPLVPPHRQKGAAPRHLRVREGIK